MKFNTKFKLIWQLIKFSACGVTCFAIDYSLMLLLTEVFGVRYLISAGISFVFATSINYFISAAWVYDTENRKRRKYDIFVFIILGAIGLGINQFIMWSMVEFIQWDYRVVKIVSGIIVSIYNFITRKRFLEGKKKDVKPA